MKQILWLLFLFSPDLFAQDLEAELWARASAPGAKAGAVYGQISNQGNTVATLHGVSAAVAGKTEIHESIMTGDMMRMRYVGPVEIEPGQSITLTPGGIHIMLMGLAQPLTPGSVFSLELLFENQPAIETDVLVGSIGQLESPKQRDPE